MRRILLTVGVLAFGAWPLFLLYVHDVLWPSANLGAIGAVQIADVLGANALWRATRADVSGRARIGAVVAVAAAAALAAVRPPADNLLEQAAVVVAFLAAAASMATAMTANMELAHRAVDHRTSVRAMTLYDVVASTSLQAGLLVGGVLVSISADRTDWALDPYRIYLLALAGLAVGVLQYRPRHDDDRP
jgi:hypothetical protein